MAEEQKQHWLMKSEPDEFSIDDLARVRVEPWSGVRSYMARAHLRAMRVGDLVLFHHSSVEPPGVAGLARVVRTGVVDEKQFDRKSPYYEPRATREQPIWDCVDVEYVATFPHFVAMDRLRAEPACAEMLVLRRGMRLSVQPVTAEEYAAVVALGSTAPPPEVTAPQVTPEASTKRRSKSAVKSRSTSRPARPRPAKAKPRPAKAKPRPVLASKRKAGPASSSRRRPASSA
jgi:predicted RNA-binding protein with PUA-like domain